MKVLQTHPAFTPNPPMEVTLKDDLVYENDKYIIRVHAGYRCDGGSIPRAVWTLLGVTPFDPRCVYAFFIHDFLYQSELLGRSINDALLYEVLCIEPRCNFVQRRLILRAVRCFGWMAYRDHTQESIEEGRKFGEVVEKKKLLKTVIK